MQAFEFRLESVLRFQERCKKLADVQRQQARMAVRMAEDQCGQLRERLGEVGAHLAASVGHGRAAAAWHELHAQAQWLADRLAAAEQTLRGARQTVARADERYREAATRVEAVGDLKARRWQEYRDEAARLEQARVEEVVLRRWNEATIGNGDDPNGKDLP